MDDMHDSGLRASDADRERVVEQLREHGGAGRLTPDELEERVEEAYAARTMGELRATLRELPVEEERRPRREARPSRPRWRWAAMPVPLLVIAGVVAAIALTDGHLWWIVFPALAVWHKGRWWGGGPRWSCGPGHRRHRDDRETVVV